MLHYAYIVLGFITIAFAVSRISKIKFSTIVNFMIFCLVVYYICSHVSIGHALQFIIIALRDIMSHI